MKTRSFFLGLCGAVVFVLGCGGESASYPPPDSLPPTPPAESTSSPADKPAGSEAATQQKPAGETTTAATNAPAASGDKPVANDKPATSDKPATAEKPAEKPAASDVPGANISVGRLEADGLVTKNIECKSEGSGGGLGLLGAVLVTAWMSPQKKALDACAAQETETRVVWKARGGKVTELEAKGDAKVKACVEKALRPGKPVFEGHCAATVVHGKK